MFLMKYSSVIVAPLLFLITPDTSSAASKKFNVCLNSDEPKSLIKYGGLEIKAKCLFTAVPGFEWEPKIYFSSSVPNVKTSQGFYANPFEYLMFTYYWSDCDNSTQTGVMVTEKGHYLSMDGESLIMCMDVGNCKCSLSGVINKHRIKQKIVAP